MANQTLVEILKQGRRAYVATNGNDGTPNLRGMSFAIDEDKLDENYIYFLTYPGMPKLEEIEKNGKGSILIETGLETGDMSQIKYVRLYGKLGIAETPEQNQLAKDVVTKKEPSIAQMDNFENMVGIRFSAEKVVIYDLSQGMGPDSEETIIFS